MEQMMATEPQRPRKAATRELIPWIVLLVGALALVVAFVLPFATATDEYADYLGQFADQMNMEEIGLRNADAANLSMLTFLRMYLAAFQATESLGVLQSVAALCVGLIGAIAVSSLLALVFAVLRKPIGAVVFALIAMGPFALIRWDFADRSVLPSSTYDYGIAAFVYPIAFVVLVVGAIWLIVARRAAKKAVSTASI